MRLKSPIMDSLLEGSHNSRINLFLELSRGLHTHSSWNQYSNFNILSLDLEKYALALLSIRTSGELFKNTNCWFFLPSLPLEFSLQWSGWILGINNYKTFSRDSNMLPELRNTGLQGISLKHNRQLMHPYFIHSQILIFLNEFPLFLEFG